jgi:hypothetical protein
VGTDAPSLTRRILAVLEESPLPIRTPDLVVLVRPGGKHPAQNVWAKLQILLDDDLVVKHVPRSGKHRNGVYWTLKSGGTGGEGVARGD